MRDNAAELARLQTAYLVPMRASALRLRKAAANLEERVRFNQSSLAVAIEMLIGQAEAAQTFLQDKGPEQLTKVTLEVPFLPSLPSSLPPSTAPVSSRRKHDDVFHAYRE